MTAEEAAAHQKKHGFPIEQFVKKGQAAQAAVDKLIPKKLRRLEPPKMNQTEREFSMFLEARKTKGEITSYKFQGVRLMWGDGMIYKPDFNALRSDGRIELIEVKGAKIWDRDTVRFKGARAEWRDFFIFEMHQKLEGQWNRLA